MIKFIPKCPLKIGDKVRCISREKSQSIQVGREYDIKEITYKHQRWFVKIHKNQNTPMFFADRFEKV